MQKRMYRKIYKGFLATISMSALIFGLSACTGQNIDTSQGNNANLNSNSGQLTSPSGGSISPSPRTRQS